LEPASREAKDDAALDGASRIPEPTAVAHNKPIGLHVMRHSVDIWQLCQSRSHVTRSAPLAQHARDFDHGSFAVVADDVHLRIGPDVA